MGRLIWMGAARPLRQLEMVIGAPLDVDLPSDADATLAAIDPDRLDDARPRAGAAAPADRRATRLSDIAGALRAHQCSSRRTISARRLDLAPSLVAPHGGARARRGAAPQPPGRPATSADAASNGRPATTTPRRRRRRRSGRPSIERVHELLSAPARV